MSGKDVKGLLKEAREAIKNKDFQSSLNLSKAILKHDDKNYMALVFLGLSLQEAGPTNSAPDAFQKAVDLNPTNVLAWNGLANYYEKQKNEDAQKELVKVYTKLLQLETNEKKLGEFCEKLASLSTTHENQESIMCMAKVAKSSDCSRETITAVWTSVVSVISKISEVPTSLLKIYEEALLYVLAKPNLTTKQYYLEYLKLLYKQNKYSLLLQEAEKMHKLYDADVASLEWMCKVYNELVIEGQEIHKEHENIEKYCDTLLTLQGNSSMGLFTKAVLLSKEGKFVESKELLQEVTNLRPGLLHAWVLLTSCFVKLHVYSDATSAALRASKLLQSKSIIDTNLQLRIDTLLCEAYSRDVEDENLKKGVDLCSKVLKENTENSDNLISLIRCYIGLENYSAAKSHLSILKSMDEQRPLFLLLNAQLLNAEGQVEKALKMLKSEKDVNVAEWWFEIGHLYWKTKEFGKSLVPFLKAAKLDPNCYLYFLHLGHYYKFGDLEKARRCYEKAFKMNPKCIEAAAELTKLYRKLKNWDVNISLLQSVTGGMLEPENCWAWLQLGLNYLAQEDYANAIDTLRFVVRGNPENSHCWESLADAYFARGAYTSALKSYQKAAEVSSNTNLYALLQVANIKQAIGEFTEARADYEAILSTNKCYVLALKGIAETCIQQARQHRRDQLTARARDCAQHALDMLTIGIQQRNDLLCLWKLAGDSCLLVATFPERYSCLLVLAALATGQPIEGNKALEKEDLFVLAERCYYKALSLAEDKIPIWHDLAACYLSQVCSCTDAEKASSLCKKSFNIIQHCVSANPKNCEHWNLMGVIVLKTEPINYALAQHCFIKAVTVKVDSAVSWCNLGTLYFVLGEFKLANQAFSQAQRADPNYVNSWVGQALIAESIGLDDAMDLFRHSLQLGFHSQGSIGYGHWVCTKLLESPENASSYSIRNMYAIPVACDAVGWYTENHSDDPCAWNILGLLKERMDLRAGSAKAFKKAMLLCSEDLRDKLRVNYGRILFKQEKYDSAIEVYRNVQEATFSSGSGLALALFKNQQFEESYETYEQVLHWLANEQDAESDLLVALASMAYMFQGAEAAKTLLLQSTQLKTASPNGLFATLALGLITKDFNLSSVVLKELHEVQDNSQFLQHYATLLCYSFILQGLHLMAVPELSKIIHRHPEQASLWLLLSTLLVRLHKHRTLSQSAAMNCAQSAIKLEGMNKDVSKVMHVVFLATFLSGNYEQALKIAQKSIHCHPDVAESWMALLCASFFRAKELNRKLDESWLQKLVAHVTTQNPSPLIEKWLKQHNVVK